MEKILKKLGKTRSEAKETAKNRNQWRKFMHGKQETPTPSGRKRTDYIYQRNNTAKAFAKIKSQRKAGKQEIRIYLLGVRSNHIIRNMTRISKFQSFSS